jgi:hypothetical protein
MNDEVKEAMVYMSDALKALLGLCDDLVEDGETAATLEEIRNAKTHYEEVLRVNGVLPPLVDEAPPKSEGAPMDLVSLAQSMSEPAADEHQDGK